MSRLHIGDLHRITATFKNGSGTATDPSTVTLLIQKPDDTQQSLTLLTTPPIVKTGTGVYHYDVDIDQEGVWKVKWYGDGFVTTAEPSDFYVTRSIAPVSA
jgi:hypothetical protein